MASYAPLYHSIWTDEDFAGLSPNSKLLYIMLVSHPKLTRCGALDLMPTRWSKATGMTRADVDQALDELADAHFVLVDYDSEELAVRSKVKNDRPGTWMHVKAVWKAWEAIESRTLRDALTREFTDECWAFQEKAPSPCDRASDTHSDTHSESAGDTHSREALAPVPVSSTCTPTPPLPDSRTYKGNPTPVDNTVTAMRSRMAINARRANGESCTQCDDTGHVDSFTRPGSVQPCPECRPGVA
jgi:hypothetical protein